jgi:flagellar basal body-associated protein FliL
MKTFLKKNLKIQQGVTGTVIALSILLVATVFYSPAQAQVPNAENPNSPGFRVVICDGPEGLGRINPTTGAVDNSTNPDGSYVYPVKAGYVPCNFVGIMKQVQHLINIMLMLGILAAIAGITFAGYLYITGSEKNISRAKDMFPKMAWGFVLMLTAWFIVYQILNWLTDNGSGFSSLLK